MSLIGQLERLGGLEEWVLYIVLHLPDGSQADKVSARDDLVLKLLHRHAPVWAASKQKQAFLIKTLGLPPAWLASALATFAAYKKDRASEPSSLYLRLAEGEMMPGHTHSTCIYRTHGLIAVSSRDVRIGLQRRRSGLMLLKLH